MSNNRPEITAEWTVHAQLTISRPGDTATKTATNSNEQDNGSSSAADHNSADKQQSSSNPVTVVYKWSTDDIDNNKRASSCGSSFLNTENLHFKNESTNKVKVFPNSIFK